MSPDWLGASRRAASALRVMLAERTTIAERVLETGTRGEGGDRTLEIDALTEERVELAPGEALVLYTDGVTEADREAGPERLAALLESCAGAGAAAIAEHVERDALAAHGGSARDDVAVVVVRAAGLAAPFGRHGDGVATAT